MGLKRLTFSRLLIGGLAVVSLHCAATFLLYRARVVGGSQIAQSDSIVFELPLLLAVMSFGSLVARSTFLNLSRPLLRACFIVGLSAITGAGSFLVIMLILLNTYGS
jgi:hypothetical protein